MKEAPSCLLCQHPHLKSLSCQDGRRYWECERCEYLFLDPSQRLALIAERERYLLHDNNLEDPSYFKYLRKTWDKLIVEPGWIPQMALDYGCGPTKGLEAVLLESAVQVWSYDPIFYPEKNWPREGFDVIYCSEALEHAFSPADVFSEWIDRLKSDGQIVLRTQFHSGIEAVESWWYASDPTHVGFFNATTFDYVAQTWGLQVKHLHSPYVVLSRK